MKRLFSPRLKNTASSLVTTLLVLVVLSTIVVAFMQSMSIERMTAKSVKSMLQAELAAQAGIETAKRQIGIAVSSNFAYVVGQTNDALNYGPVLVIGQTNLTNFQQMMPLISGNLTNLSGFPSADTNAIAEYINARTNLNSSNTVNVNLRNELIENISNTNKYRASWVYLTNDDGTTNARYAYIVLDEWARANPRYHGNTNISRANATNWFPGIDALPLYTGGTNLLSLSEAASNRAIATNTQPAPLTPLTIGQAFSNRSTYVNKKNLLTIDDGWSMDIIPGDLAEGGKPKYNINDLATNITYGADSTARANRIADIIITNFPNFGKRDPGLQTEDPTGSKYVRRLAASIVDYIDTDTIPTQVNDGEPAGKELAPYVAMVAERNTWVSETGATAPYTVKIRSEFFLQLWNPYTVDVSGQISLEILNRQYIEMREGGSSTDLNPFTSAPVNVSLRPNEMKAVSLGSVDQDFVNNVNRPSSSSARYPKWPTTSSGGSSLTGHPQFRMNWNGALLDMNRQEDIMEPPASSGLVRQDPGNTFGSIGIMRWSFNYVPSNTPNTVADPRGSWLCGSDWAGAANIALANWQGRQTDTAGRSQNLQAAWASRDYVPNNPSSGITLTATTGNPTSLASQYNATNDAKNAPALIRNQAMLSIGELGNIFDPVQINDTGGNASGGSPPSYYRPVGGFSLRIGQPEFTFASTNGRRAIELLDIFTVNTTNAFSTNFPATRGRINVNTAPQPVLEALFFNIAPTSDLNRTNVVISQANASNLATVVISNRPYNKLSDLQKITSALVNATNYTPILANVATNANSPTLAAQVLDRAREEPFAKMVGFATVQSRTFRLITIGEALNPKTGKREARAAAEVLISIQEDGSTNLSPSIQYIRWDN